MNNLLEQKIALENLWTKMYKHYGVYTNQMVNLDKALTTIKRKIILQDIEAVKNKIHNQI
jgi:hypothetical protein|tara:strand:- start:1098 stop:1277 length:180 start_codon:yes stop_codon:yes gene_type:complete